MRFDFTKRFLDSFKEIKSTEEGETTEYYFKRKDLNRIRLTKERIEYARKTPEDPDVSWVDSFPLAEISTMRMDIARKQLTLFDLSGKVIIVCKLGV